MGKVKVCDAICGAGKTQSCITMMNSDTDKRFIFITPYLSEIERIKEQCSQRGFVSPDNTNSNKLESIHKLLRAKKNIASTHALFSYYTDETKQLIVDGGYTLVLDEVMNIFQPVDISVEDMNILVKSNTVTANNNDEYEWNDLEYGDGTFADIKFKARSNNLLKYKDEMYFWSIPPDAFKCFKEIYILTYMFQYQIQKYFFDVYGIEFELIGTKKVDGQYMFCPIDEMDRKRDLRDKIHILDSYSLNKIGDEQGSLSFNWYNKANQEEGKPKLKKLKQNMCNLFVNVYKGDSNLKMWSTFKDYKDYLKGKGYTKSFIAFNKRATNDFADRKYLAYCLNVYMQTWAKNYLLIKGAKDISENMYAISTLIQWLFRSAIRKGEEVWLYLPSKRMRLLFIKWLDNLAEGKDLEAITTSEIKGETGDKNTKAKTLKEKVQQFSFKSKSKEKKK